MNVRSIQKGRARCPQRAEMFKRRRASRTLKLTNSLTHKLSSNFPASSSPDVTDIPAKKLVSRARVMAENFQRHVNHHDRRTVSLAAGAELLHRANAENVERDQHEPPENDLKLTPLLLFPRIVFFVVTHAQMTASKGPKFAESKRPISLPNSRIHQITNSQTVLRTYDCCQKIGRSVRQVSFLWETT